LLQESLSVAHAVYDIQNRKIGKVHDLVLDRSGQIAAVVVDVGSFLGMGGKNVAVKPGDIKTDHNRLTLDVTKEQLYQMANYRLEDRNTGAGSSASPVKGGHLGRQNQVWNRGPSLGCSCPDLDFWQCLSFSVTGADPA